MKKAVLAMVLFAGTMLAGPRITVGIGFGAPAIRVVRPICPGPGYVWLDGCWRAPVEVGPRFVERRFVEPRFVGPHYYAYDRRYEFHRGFRR